MQAQVAEASAHGAAPEAAADAGERRGRASRLVDRHCLRRLMRGRDATAERRLSLVIDLYQQAVAADAGLAEAYAGLAEALHLESAFLGAAGRPRPARAVVNRRRDACLRAGSDLPQANLAAALVADRLADTRVPEESDRGRPDPIRRATTRSAIRFRISIRRARSTSPARAGARSTHDVNHADIVSALLALGRFSTRRRRNSTRRPTPPRRPGRRQLSLAIALDHKQYDAALSLLRTGTLIKDAPIFALNYAARAAHGRTA